MMNDDNDLDDELLAGPRRPRLSRRQIVYAALALVDREGLDALSMRRLGAELGVEAMSLYRYFENKAMLIDGLVAAVWSEMDLSGLERIDDPTERLCELARRFRRLAHAHPNVLGLLATRAVHIHAALRPIELTLATLVEAGLEEAMVVQVFHVVVSYLHGYCLQELALAGDQPKKHLWFDLERVPAERFPTVVSLAPQFVHGDFDAGFELGLQAMLTGLKTLLDTSSACSRP
jgi:AcrR family transcriptional regulator